MIEITGVFKVKKVALISLGCSKNRVDSEKLLSRLSDGGIQIVSSEWSDSSDFKDYVVINTCGFIKSAKEESINEILSACKDKQEGRVGGVVVCGCLSERYKNDLSELLPEVDAFFGTYQWDELVAFILNDKKNSSPKREIKRLISTPSHYAYLKISDGCNRKCSYCAIPLIKGKYRSIPIPTLVTEAKTLAKSGVKELILIAQDTTYYGVDLYKKKMITSLVEELTKIKGIEWIRIHYSYPQSFPEELLLLMNSNPKICKYIDIPLQHCSDSVLKAMRRGIDHKKTQMILDTIREKVPGIAIRTTLMVGHPGEGRKEFSELLQFVKKNQFERVGAFRYSEEENTYGAIHFRDSIAPKTKQNRYDKLMALQSQISLQNNQKRVGKIEKVIIDSYSEGQYIARSQWESPEIDGVILIKIKKSISEAKNIDPKQLIGTFVSVRIVAASEYDLVGELI